MISRSVFVSTLLIAAALGTGYFLGKRSTMPATQQQGAALQQPAEPSPRTHISMPSRRVASANDADSPATALLSKLQTTQASELFRVKDWSQILQGIDPSGIPTLLADLEKNPSKAVRDRIRMLLLPRWAQSDPTAAITYASGITNRTAREQATLAVLRGWAENDPASAAAWAKALPAGQFRTSAINSVLNNLAAVDPQAALDLQQSSAGNRPWQFGQMNTIFNAWADKDVTTAAAKAVQLPAGEQRLQALQAVASTWASKDPAQAIAWANSLSNPNERRSVIGSIVSQWAGSDLNAANAWVQALPEGPVKQSALSSLGSQWSQLDPKAAMAFAQNLPPGNARNSLLGQVVSQWAQQDPTAALDYVQGLQAGPEKNRRQLCRSHSRRGRFARS